MINNFKRYQVDDLNQYTLEGRVTEAMSPHAGSLLAATIQNEDFEEDFNAMNVVEDEEFNALNPE